LRRFDDGWNVKNPLSTRGFDTETSGNPCNHWVSAVSSQKNHCAKRRIMRWNVIALMNHDYKIFAVAHVCDRWIITCWDFFKKQDSCICK
jgi:hypothetical protein